LTRSLSSRGRTPSRGSCPHRLPEDVASHRNHSTRPPSGFTFRRSDTRSLRPNRSPYHYRPLSPFHPAMWRLALPLIDQMVPTLRSAGTAQDRRNIDSRAIRGVASCRNRHLGDQGRGRKPEQSVPPSRPATVSAPAPPTPLDPPIVLQVDDTRSTASKVLAGSDPVLDLFGSGECRCSARPISHPSGPI
jgi:hypothetical protein